MSDLRELGERFFFSNTCCRNFVFKIIKPSDGSKEVSMAEFEDFEWRVLSCGVNLDMVKILNAHVYVWWSYFMFIYLRWKDWLTCEEGLAVHDYNTLDGVLLRVLAWGRARAKRGVDVDGVFWYTKHVHYTLVWIWLWNYVRNQMLVSLRGGGGELGNLKL
jgi:hypothetical protein